MGQTDVSTKTQKVVEIDGGYLRCGNCGNEVEYTDNNCPNCGAELGEIEE